MSGMIKDLTACFDGRVDPRVTRRCDHRLIDILVIAVSAVIACAESWEDIELYGRSKLAWLKTGPSQSWGSSGHCHWRVWVVGRQKFLPETGAECAVVEGTADLE